MWGLWGAWSAQLCANGAVKGVKSLWGRGRVAVVRPLSAHHMFWALQLGKAGNLLQGRTNEATHQGIEMRKAFSLGIYHAPPPRAPPSLQHG